MAINILFYKCINEWTRKEIRGGPKISKSETLIEVIRTLNLAFALRTLVIIPPDSAAWLKEALLCS